ncbi:2-amino-4-hydroxy-6-hydroxymethyldihydropteridine diphosphokinase [Salibacteraceae bacterium]|jgi:2-amino-4-hydroxy-6-hydroxymethyldihydropteridine diphosphokinase|nr:2-amino-4-hydroxy-6-hydroxymethyldihydropteridine diphosphokinase [Bacteroidota bacterium]MDA9967878.1 2-amino-4-hydroxy-6-hydroxymethyldihydropteridine diphosphokinase [Salibacteraceae bacterium]MDB9725490.1 2-amino-4-hydroxy-6-hydroxymethyldihydropteridine diphosphokinase [Salibacteraceae bacterium]MDC1204304.1 2-amino-4-hydroxy-6-hydroxymethyldihydropteridine diphosphokinase [Salibacteraceae bacterium]
MENKKKQTVYIAYGSNMGNWEEVKEKVFLLIENSVGSIIQKSKTYQTPAWGKTDQPDFKNGIIKINTELSPQSCLLALQNIENQLGRIRTEKWGPRIIDLDIIDFDGLVFSTHELILPHPYAHKRQFVLEPLADIAPNLMLPNCSKSVSKILNSLEDKVVLKILE